MSRLALGLFYVVILLGVPVVARAQTCSATASAVNFGSVSPIALSAVNTTGTVTVTCSWPKGNSKPNVLVCLNLTGTPRNLANGANAMQYNLYQDAAYSLSWGSAQAGGTPISLQMTKPSSGSATTTVTVYGQIAANQPTVPVVSNSSTVYSQSFSGTATSINYRFYKTGQPTCSSLSTSNGTFPFTASATVINDCNISTTNISFSVSGQLTATLSATGSITVRCTNADAWQIALDGGSSGNVASRRMTRTGGGGQVNYQLYSDASHTTAWGDGTAGTSMATSTGTGNQQVVTVYGAVPTQTTPAPGSYSDTITATIKF